MREHQTLTEWGAMGTHTWLVGVPEGQPHWKLLRAFLQVKCTPIPCLSQSNSGYMPKIAVHSGYVYNVQKKCFGHLIWRADSLKKTLLLGKIEGNRRMRQQRMRWLDSTTDSIGHESEQILGDTEGQRSLVCCSPWGCKGSDVTERMNGNYWCSSTGE